MRPRTTILLGLIFVGLVVAYMFTNVRTVRQMREAWEAKRLFQIEPAAIAGLSIQQQGAAAVEALREGDGWRFVGSQSDVAPNTALWEQLAAAVATATNERPLDKADLAAFELDKPKLTVSVTLKEGEPETITFGALDPTQRHRYARLSDGTIFLARAELFSALDRPLLDLRDRRIFTNLAEGISRVDYLRRPVEVDESEPLDEEVRKHTISIDESYARGEDGRWSVTRPATAYAWQARLDLLERALQTLNAREFIDQPESLADYGLEAPFSTLTVYGKDGKPQVASFGWLEDNTEGAGIYMKRADSESIAVVDASVLVVLPREPDAFREKRLFTGDARSLVRVRYRDPGSEFELENDAETGWRLAGPGADDTDQTAVSLYLGALKNIQGQTFPAGDVSSAFDAPRIELNLTYSDGRPASKIVVGSPVPGAAADSLAMYAKQDFGQATTISIQDFVSLQADRFRFRQKNFFAFERSLASDVDLTVDGARYHFTQANGRWSVVEPAGHRLEAQTPLTGFLDNLAKTIVTGLVDPAPTVAIQGTEAPILEVAIRIAGPNPRTVGPIRVGNLITPASRNRFVTISGRDSVYTVDQILVDDARRAVEAVRPQ